MQLRRQWHGQRTQRVSLHRYLVGKLYITAACRVCKEESRFCPEPTLRFPSEEFLDSCNSIWDRELDPDVYEMEVRENSLLHCTVAQHHMGYTGSTVHHWRGRWNYGPCHSASYWVWVGGGAQISIKAIHPAVISSNPVGEKVSLSDEKEEGDGGLGGANTNS